MICSNFVRKWKSWSNEWIFKNLKIVLDDLTWNFDLGIGLQKIIEMHPNWMPQEIALTFIHMYSSINITLAQVKQHLKYFETKQNKVDKKFMLINDIDNAFRIYFFKFLLIKKILGSLKWLKKWTRKNSIK